MNRRAFLTALGGSFLAAPLAGEAQHPSRARIGWFALARVPSDVATFRERLRALGWVEGENASTEERYSESKSERFPSLAADLVRAKVDVIVAIGTGVAAAAQQATASIPVVFVVGTDPVERGFVASFGRPGGNLTGIASLGNEMLNAKMLEVLRNAVPGITRVGVFHQPTLIQRQAMTVVGAGARALSVQLVPIEVRSASDIDHATLVPSPRSRPSALRRSSSAQPRVSHATGSESSSWPRTTGCPRCTSGPRRWKTAA